MAASEIGLIARAHGVATHLLARRTLDSLATAEDIQALARGLVHQGTAIDALGEPVDVFAIERAVGGTANRHFGTLYRWQVRTPGVLDVFAAHQDRRSLRALLRGAAEGAAAAARLQGLFPTPSLPQLALLELARQSSPAAVVRQLVMLAHPDGGRLASVVQQSQVDLLAVDVALLRGFAERVVRIAARADDELRQFVSVLIDLGNAQSALLIAREPADVNPPDLFVSGGRWLTQSTFVSAARAGSTQHALLVLTAALASSPMGPLLPVVPTDVAHLDRRFLITALERVTRAARLDPLSTASVVRVLLLIEAQSLDLRALAWGAAFGTPPSMRQQQLVTPA